MLLAFSALVGGRRPGRENYLQRADETRMRSLADRPILDRLIGPAAAGAGRCLANRLGNQEADALLLVQAGYPKPFHSLADFYGWKVISAFVMFLLGLFLAMGIGAPPLAVVALGLGVLGLYMPDLSLRKAARKRQELFKLEMAFTLDRLAMFVSSMVPENALRDVARRGGGLFIAELREAVAQFDMGKTMEEGLSEVAARFPLPEYVEFVQALQLARETGTKLSTVLGSMALHLQNDMENELLAKGTAAVLPMVLGMGMALFGILVAIGAPALYLFMTSGGL
jgi:Flp pilus assembly protein TadB